MNDIIIFMNDIIRDLPRNVYGAIHTDDLVLWCSVELITINARKTTYAVSLQRNRK